MEGLGFFFSGSFPFQIFKLSFYILLPALCFFYYILEVPLIPTKCIKS